MGFSEAHKNRPLVIQILMTGCNIRFFVQVQVQGASEYMHSVAKEFGQPKRVHTDSFLNYSKCP